jgi:hypothetical protein
MWGIYYYFAASALGGPPDWPPTLGAPRLPRVVGPPPVIAPDGQSTVLPPASILFADDEVWELLQPFTNPAMIARFFDIAACFAFALVLYVARPEPELEPSSSESSLSELLDESPGSN